MRLAHGPQVEKQRCKQPDVSIDLHCGLAFAYNDKNEALGRGRGQSFLTPQGWPFVVDCELDKAGWWEEEEVAILRLLKWIFLIRKFILSSSDHPRNKMCK